MAPRPVAFSTAGLDQYRCLGGWWLAAVQAHGTAGAQPHGDSLPHQSAGQHRLFQPCHAQAFVQAAAGISSHQQRCHAGWQLWLAGHGHDCRICARCGIREQTALAGFDCGRNHACRPLWFEWLPAQYHARDGSTPCHQLAQRAVLWHQHLGFCALHVFAFGQKWL